MSAVIRRYIEEEYVKLRCGHCGIIFYVLDEWKQRVWNEKRDFYCPNGHRRIPVVESQKDRADRLERELIAAKDAKAFMERRLADEQVRQKAELERIKKRSHAGVCQECHRTFKNVARHMKSKHSS